MEKRKYRKDVHKLVFKAICIILNEGIRLVKLYFKVVGAKKQELRKQSYNYLKN